MFAHIPPCNLLLSIKHLYTTYESDVLWIFVCCQFTGLFKLSSRRNLKTYAILSIFLKKDVERWSRTKIFPQKPDVRNHIPAGGVSWWSDGWLGWLLPTSFTAMTLNWYLTYGAKESVTVVSLPWTLANASHRPGSSLFPSNSTIYSGSRSVGGKNPLEWI